MKKFNTVDSGHILSWVVCCLLLFAASFTGTFAYFTATTANKIASTPTAQVKIGFYGNPEIQINENSAVLLYSGFPGEEILPGDTVHLSATIKNVGNVKIYAVAEIRVYVSDTTISSNSVPRYVFYTTCDGSTEYTQTAGKYTDGAETILSNGTVNFSYDYEFDADEYDNTFKSNNIQISILLHAIQFNNVSSVSETGLSCSAAVNATNIMLLGQGWVSTYLASLS